MTKNDLDKDGSVSDCTEEVQKTKPQRGNPYEEVQIYDTTCNKIRKARNFKISSYEETDANGEVQLNKSVEFIIVGNNRTWKMFIPFDEFVRTNPDVELP